MSAVTARQINGGAEAVRAWVRDNYPVAATMLTDSMAQGISLAVIMRVREVEAEEAKEPQ